MTNLVNIGLASPFTFALKVCLVSGLVLTSPVSSLSFWSFVVLTCWPRQVAIIFIGTATHIFLAGVGHRLPDHAQASRCCSVPARDGVADLQNIDFLSFMLPLIGHSASRS